MSNDYITPLIGIAGVIIGFLLSWGINYAQKRELREKYSTGWVTTRKCGSRL